MKHATRGADMCAEAHANCLSIYSPVSATTRPPAALAGGNRVARSAIRVFEPAGAARHVP